MGSTSPEEAATAHKKLIELLAKHGCSWNDLRELLEAAEADMRMQATTRSPSSATASASSAPAGPVVNVLELTMRLIELYIFVTPHERMAIALWLLHTWVFERFIITPRLALLSPIEGCGKTTLLALLEALARKPWRTDDVSAAAIYYQVAREPHTSFMIDEGDNLGLLENHFLRRVFNSGHRRGGNTSRFIDGRPRKIPTFAPLAVAAIGNVLPRPFMHRSVLISMMRPPPDVGLERLDEQDPSLSASRAEIEKWAHACALTREPTMPAELRNREADNWRVLLAIADDLGHGEQARVAAIALTTGRHDEPVSVTLLRHIRDVFDSHDIDRCASKQLVAELLALPDGAYNEWRGPRDDRPPRKLTMSALAEALAPFGIRPKPLWPRQRKPGDKTFRGYDKEQFATAWAIFCTQTTRSAQAASNVFHLPSRKGTE
jgi:hypothetical protein